MKLACRLDRMTEKPSGRGRVYDITFKSEGQFRRCYEVNLMLSVPDGSTKYPLKESRDDFDYLDIEAAMRWDAKLEALKKLYRKQDEAIKVMVFSRKLQKNTFHRVHHRFRKQSRSREGCEDV